MEQPHMLQLSFTVNTTPADALATLGGIDPQRQNILSPASEQLKPMIPISLQTTSMISVTKLLWIYQNTWHKSPKSYRQFFKITLS